MFNPQLETLQTMKRVLFFAIVGAILAACNEDEPVYLPEPKDDTEVVTLTFRQKYTTEPMSKAAIDEMVTRLDVYLICGTEVMEFHQDKTVDEAFGVISATLNKTKTYNLYAVGHKGASPVTLEDNVFSFVNNKVTETLFNATTFTPSYASNLNITMDRVIGQFRFIIQDALPENMYKIKFSVSDTGLGMNLQGNPANMGTKVSEFVNPSTNTDGSTLFKIYCIATNTVETVDVTVTAYDDEDNVIEEKTFEDVPLRRGYVTTYKGTFFVSTNLSFSFTCSSEWTNYDEVNY